MANLKFLQVPAEFNTVGLSVVWIIVGLIAIYAGIKNLLDKENPSRIGTAVFWCSFGIVCAFGDWLPAKVSGILVIVMCMPPIFKRVKVGKVNAPEKSHTVPKNRYENFHSGSDCSSIFTGICLIYKYQLYDRNYDRYICSSNYFDGILTERE